MNNSSPQIIHDNGNPWVFLNVNGQMFCYDSQSQPLGEGAMGIVFLGFNCNSNQRVAIKCVRSSYANNPLIRQRARQEASLLFKHPNIVEMIGMCEYPNGTGPIYILSSYISGITLEDHVKSQLNCLTQKDRIQKISFEICCILDALQHLHSYGVVHRDIKPTNLMIENGSVVKLMDLGIARVNGGNQYSTYGFIGTPEYAAPEQILRETQDVEFSAATDIYSLGITYYELLTGTNPMKSTVDAETLSNQVSKKLPYHNDIPRPLFKAIQKATEKKHSKRFQSAAEFKDAILNALNKPDTPALLMWMDEHKAAATLIIIGILTVITTIIYLCLHDTTH